MEWDTDPGVQEVQTLTTSTYAGANEIQSITTSAAHIQEQQMVTINATAVNEVQRVTVTGATGGSFFLVLDTSATGGSLQYSGDIYIDYPASGSSDGRDVSSIMESMSNINDVVSVTLTTPSLGEYNYLITFPLSMGNVPQMSAIFASLSPTGVNVIVDTPIDGNEVGGTFRLTFEEQTTSSLQYDASENDVRIALESLSTIGTVQVLGTGPDYQQGYSWLVTFTSGMNSGYQPKLYPDYSGLTVSSSAKGASAQIVVTTIVPGNEIGGTFTVLFTDNTGSLTTSRPIWYNSTAADFQDAFNGTLSGSLSVVRTGPDLQMGYTWKISFLENYSRLFEGPQNAFLINSSLTGVGVMATVAKVRVGSSKEVQMISVGTINDYVNHSSVMVLSYMGENTIPISLLPFSNTTNCNSSVTEVQTVSSSTNDATRFGGADHVSVYLMMRLRYRDEVTPLINVNPSGSGDCSVTATAITAALENLSVFDVVEVTGESSGSTLLQSECLWTIRFISSIGDIDQLQVQAYNSATGAYGIYGQQSTAGEDTLTTATVTQGEKDSIKAALEMLAAIGSVTVKPVGINGGSQGTCSWRVTFDTNIGDLSLLDVNVFDSRYTALQSTSGLISSPVSTSNGITVSVTEVVPGTGSSIAGNFVLSFRGARTIYMPYNVSAYDLSNALESLDTIGRVNVVRSAPTENNGYTWRITFLTELGNLNAMIYDGTDMTGTAVYGVVAKSVPGVMPPFNSLSVSDGLPLGAAVVTDLTDLSLLVGYLSQGIAYYFRVSATNSLGQGPYAFASVPYVIPELQLPGGPSNVNLTVVDGTTLKLSFSPPALDGGSNIMNYKVSYVIHSIFFLLHLLYTLSRDLSKYL